MGLNPIRGTINHLLDKFSIINNTRVSMEVIFIDRYKNNMYMGSRDHKGPYNNNTKHGKNTSSNNASAWIYP